jgi:hypothetical protein
MLMGTLPLPVPLTVMVLDVAVTLNGAPVCAVKLNGLGTACNSTEPMSTTPWARGSPRWSVAGRPAPAGSPAFTTGLENDARCVCVGPPLLASGASSGSTPVRLLAPPIVAPAVFCSSE